jgi:hypothetical protein
MPSIHTEILLVQQSTVQVKLTQALPPFQVLSWLSRAMNIISELQSPWANLRSVSVNGLPETDKPSPVVLIISRSQLYENAHMNLYEGLGFIALGQAPRISSHLP